MSKLDLGDIHAAQEAGRRKSAELKKEADKAREAEKPKKVEGEPT